MRSFRKSCLRCLEEEGMDFSLTESQTMLRTMVREFAEKELEPIAAEIDEESRFPCEEFSHMASLGLTGLAFPQKYGGGGAGKIEEIIVDEEIARVSASVSTILFASSGLAGWPTYTYSNEEQRQRFVVPLAKGTVIASFALTEPGAGSDAAAMETTARRVPGGYRLNGTKVFITNGAEAGFVLVFATLDRKLKHRGVTGFLVEKGSPGFTIAKVEHKLGIRASSTTELVFDDCFVPEKNRLDGEGEGFKIAINAIDSSRVSVAAQGLGIAGSAFDRALSYARERRQFGQPIADFQAIQWMLADMATQMDAARLLTYRAAHLQEEGKPFIKEASMAKLFAAETAMFVTSKSLQIHGGYGYIKSFPLERYFRDARILEIYEGTSEMQRRTIAKQLLKDGHEASN
jgi:butyryl-CoA dehydrogenase